MAANVNWCVIEGYLHRDCRLLELEIASAAVTEVLVAFEFRCTPSFFIDLGSTMCNHYFYAGDILSSMSPSESLKSSTGVRDHRALPYNGWQCLCTLDLDKEVLTHHLR